jgi:DHA2 family multidrug resistance protein
MTTPADGPRQWFILATVSLATMLYAMSITVANVALPQMQGEMGATQDQIAWVITFNILATAVATPASGWLIGKMGRRRLMLVALFGFTTASILCGMATSLTDLVGYRVAQGLFGAPLVPLSQTILLSSFSKERHGLVTAIWGFGVVLGPLVGPTIGGEVAEALNWRWVFFMIAPVAAVAIGGAWLFVQNSDTDARRPLDWTGFITLSISIAAFQLMLDRGERHDWFDSNEILLEAVIAAVALYFFIYRAWTARNPFLDLGILRDTNLAIGVFFAFLFGMLNFTPMVLLPTLLRDLRDFPDSVIGWLLATRAAGNMLSFLVVVWMTRLAPRLSLMIGFSFQAIASLSMAQFDINMTTFGITWTSILHGFGVGMTWVPLTVIAFSTLNPRYLAEAAAMFHLMRNIGSSIFISISIAVVIRSTQINYGELSVHISQFREVLDLAAIRGDWNLDQAGGLRALSTEVRRQATMIGNLNAFYLLALVGFLPLPLLLLVRRTKPAAGD